MSKEVTPKLLHLIAAKNKQKREKNASKVQQKIKKEAISKLYSIEKLLRKIAKSKDCHQLFFITDECPIEVQDILSNRGFGIEKTNSGVNIRW